MSFYKDHYDVVIIGGALAGMSACLQLQAWGIKDILILEKHNMPGGLATDFVRNGFEIEATLHEMMSIGQPGKRLKVGKFFDDMGVDIDWLPVPEAYHASLPGLEVTLHPGLERFSREVDAAVPGTYEKVLKLLKLCDTVYNSVNVLSVTHMSKAKMLLKHEEFVKTAGYSAQEVIDTFDLPQKAVDLLAPYWIYVGNRLSDLPFTVWAVLMADYVGYGSYVPRKFSHEMSLKMAERAEEIHEKKLHFSDKGKKELENLSSAISSILSITTEAFLGDDAETAWQVEPLEQVIDIVCQRMREKHTARLQKGKCTLGNGYVFNDLITDFERVSDHCSNIAMVIVELLDDSLETHEMSRTIQENHLNHFDEYYNSFASRYLA